jgi:carboxyl-terminal processing protease
MFSKVDRKRTGSAWPGRLATLLISVSLSLMLTACQTYEGYPTATPEPTLPPTETPFALPAQRPTLPPPPTFTPRPAMPSAPAGAQVQKDAILKEGFNTLSNYYFQKLSNADLYEVGLQAIRKGLEQAGIQNADVPIPNFGSQDDANWNAFLQAYTLTVNKYKGQISESNLEQLALSGTANSLQDCQTAYIPPNQTDEYLALRTGQFTTVGIGITLQTGQFTNGSNGHLITRVVPGGPADKAGLKMGDQITNVDGQDTGTKKGSEVIQLLRGTNVTVGSKVQIKYRRDNSAEQTVELTRTKVQQAQMERSTLPEGIGYLRFNNFTFTDQTALANYNKALDSWMTDFSKAKLAGLILDVRGNQYGNLVLVRNVLSYFMTSSELFYLRGSQPTSQNSTARQFGTFAVASVDNVKTTDVPIVVLVDSSTSAEAEIFAYAIQQGKRGTIVGQPTAGCLAASNPVVLADQSLLNVTILRVINDPNKADSLVEGVEPEQTATLDLQTLAQGKDSQIEAAIKILKK